MNTEAMIREVKNVATKYRGKKVHTFETNIESMCSDIIPKLEQLKEYEDREKEWKEKYPNISITEDYIDNMIKNAKVSKSITFEKNLTVSVQLPNGFVLTESSACVNPENFDETIGIVICMEKIKNKLWELEGYRLQCESYKMKELYGKKEGE